MDSRAQAARQLRFDGQQNDVTAFALATLDEAIALEVTGNAKNRVPRLWNHKPPRRKLEIRNSPIKLANPRLETHKSTSHGFAAGSALH